MCTECTQRTKRQGNKKGGGEREREREKDTSFKY